MFTRVLALLPFALFASALHISARDGQCNTGNQQCCTQQIPAKQALQHFGVFEGLGASAISALVEANAPVAVGCSVISLASCKQQPTCCDNDKMESGAGVYCSPVGIL